MDVQESNVDRLLDARAEIEAALRQHRMLQSVLFTDLVGSTSYFERYGDTDGLSALYRHSALATRAVEAQQGRVVKMIGDSVMAAFPGPVAAVRAAVEIQRRLLKMNENLPERDRLQLRIGINHGTSFLHGQDLFGDMVNVAARITKLCGPAQILVSQSVQEAMAHDPELRAIPAGQEHLKGKTEKEAIYEVLWTDPAAYSQLRRHVTEALHRGELVLRGGRPEELLQREVVEARTPIVSIPARMPLPAGITARYHILGELGSGGMGIVHKAQDRETGELVALKVLRPEVAADPSITERFKGQLTAGHITFTKGERSELAELAARLLQ